MGPNLMETLIPFFVLFEPCPLLAKWDPFGR